MKLPTIKECYAMFDECHTPYHVRTHCECVMKVSLFLVDAFLKSGVSVNRDLIERAALLHDILKQADFKNFQPDQFSEEVSKNDVKIWRQQQRTYKGLHHTIAGAAYVRSRGYPEVATVMEKHGIRAIMGGPLKPTTLEEKIVFYADKRVSHDRIVSFDQRVAEAIRRHGWSPLDLEDKIPVWEKVRALEKELFSRIEIKPEEVNNLQGS